MANVEHGTTYTLRDEDTDAVLVEVEVTAGGVRLHAGGWSRTLWPGDLVELADQRTAVIAPPPDCRRCQQEALDRVGPGLLHARMILCPGCGNKRCPQATSHDLECAGSNEPGQPGSDY